MDLLHTYKPEDFAPIAVVLGGVMDAACAQKGLPAPAI